MERCANVESIMLYERGVNHFSLLIFRLFVCFTAHFRRLSRRKERLQRAGAEGVCGSARFQQFDPRASVEVSTLLKSVELISLTHNTLPTYFF